MKLLSHVYQKTHRSQRALGHCVQFTHNHKIFIALLCIKVWKKYFNDKNSPSAGKCTSNFEYNEPRKTSQVVHLSVFQFKIRNEDV